MQYLIIGRDGKDADALNRRMAVRDAHIALGDRMRDDGKMLYGAAILDEGGKMCGSILICEFETRAELEDWLKVEPYVTGDVWRDVEVEYCKVGPSFVGMKR